MFLHPSFRQDMKIIHMVLHLFAIITHIFTKFARVQLFVQIFKSFNTMYQFLQLFLSAHTHTTDGVHNFGFVSEVYLLKIHFSESRKVGVDLEVDGISSKIFLNQIGIFFAYVFKSYPG